MSLRSVAPFLIAAFLMDLCVVSVRTAVPLLGESLGASPLVVGLIATTMALVYTFMALLFGKASDRVGRTPIVFASFIVYGSGALLLSASSEIWQLFAYMSIIGVGMGMFWPIVEAWIADSEPAEGSSSVSKFCLSWSAGAMIGPVLAGYLIGSGYTYDRAFLGAAALTAVAFTVIVLTKRGTRPRTARDPDGELGRTAFPRLLFLGALAALLACWMLQSTSYTFFPLLATSRGLSPETMGLLLFCLGGARTAVFALLYRPVETARIPRVIQGALVIAILGCAIILTDDSSLGYALSLGLFGAAAGTVYILALRIALAGTQGRGSRTGLFESVIGAGALLSPIGSGLLANLRLSWAFAFNLIVLLICLLLVEAIHLKRKGG